MRNIASLIASAILFPICYFLLLDFARPALEERHLRPLWWLALGGFLVLLFIFQFGTAMAKRPKFFGLGFLLLSGCVYSYDPTINPRLTAIGLGSLWVVLLLCLMIWISLFIRATRQQAP